MEKDRAYKMERQQKNSVVLEEWKKTFNRKKSIFCGPLEKRTTEETSEVLCVECSVVWCRDLDTTTE